MKDINKIKNSIKKIVMGILITVFFIVGSVFMYHRVSLQIESKKIVDYGKKLDVFDSTMNVLIEGQGKDTVVLLTGYGTASPGLDFRPLIDELKPNHRVIVIEPFGYGLSGQTDRPRTPDNMVEEIHEVLSRLNVNSYILMGHSISGMYALSYTNKYPKEVTAFVGIDTSLPYQPWSDVPTKKIDWFQQTGLLRLTAKLKPENFYLDNLSEELNQQFFMLQMKNTGNKTLQREGKALTNSLKEAEKLTFPNNLPLLLFISGDNAENVATWRDLHVKQAAQVKKGKAIELKGGHFLHRAQSPKIVKEMTIFMNE